MKRTQIGSSAPWEAWAGYSRAVQVGNHIYISGTTATDDDGKLVGRGDPETQTRQTLANIEAALVRLGASMADVVRTRMYVTDISQWEAVGRVHGEIFGDIRPATALVAVAALVDPDMLVEIEAEAVVGVSR